jgi:hypothetical protein
MDSDPSEINDTIQRGKEIQADATEYHLDEINLRAEQAAKHLEDIGAKAVEAIGDAASKTIEKTADVATEVSAKAIETASQAADNIDNNAGNI